MKIVIIGAGGQARVVYEVLKYTKGIEVVAFVDVTKGKNAFLGLPVVTEGDIPRLMDEGVKGFIVAIGNNKVRAMRFDEFLSRGLEPINAIHPTAHIAHDVEIGNGVLISPGATIITGSKIGNNVIINTGVIVEHENIIEDHANISSGTSMAGKVTVKEGTFIGMGCAVAPELTIGKNVVVGAGTVVLKDVPDNVTVVGSPARIVNENNLDIKRFDPSPNK